MKTDITYLLRTDNREITCIDEVTEDGVIHHSNGVYFLMDNPNDEEVRIMEGFGQSVQCVELVKSMKKDEKQIMELSGHLIEIIIKDIHEGGLFQ